MHLTIIKADSAVGIDGEFLTIDCSTLPADFHALQWDGSEDGVDGNGEVEWLGQPKPPNTEISGLGDYFVYVEAWRTEKARVEAEKARIEAELAAARIKSPTPVEVLP